MKIMITLENKATESLYVDRPNVALSHVENATIHHISLDDVVNCIPMSELKNGRFRRLFNRHHRALL